MMLGPYSPAWGLLMLMQHYQDNPEVLLSLKKLYVNGAKNLDEVRQIVAYLQDESLRGFIFSADEKTITEDPTRRYFETHLAYETVKSQIDRLDLMSLKQYVEHAYELVNMHLGSEIYDIIKSTLAGEFRDESLDNTDLEYKHFLGRLTRGEIFPELSDLQREKITYLVTSSYLAINLVSRVKDLPLNIYDVGAYAPEVKGRVFIDFHGQLSTRSRHYGLIKGKMPLSRDDLAYFEQELPMVKPAEQSTYVREAEWVKTSFWQLMHPFSNSISGTMLAQLRLLALVQNTDPSQALLTSFSHIEDFLKIWTAAMLFFSGGHSFFEFIRPISLKEVCEEFSRFPDFKDVDMVSLYFEGNKRAFDQALTDTFQYQASLLQQQMMHDELLSKVGYRDIDYIPPPVVFDVEEKKSHIECWLEQLSQVNLFEGKEDLLLLKAVEELQHKFAAAEPSSYLDIEQEVLATLALTKADDLHQLKHLIINLRSGSGPHQKEKNIFADKIENLLLGLSLAERSVVLSPPSPPLEKLLTRLKTLERYWGPTMPSKFSLFKSSEEQEVDEKTRMKLKK